MRLGAAFRRAERVQQSLAFKVIASAIVVIAAVGGLIAYYVAVTAPAADALQPTPVEAGAEPPPAAPTGEPADPLAARRAAAEKSAIDSGQRILAEILSARASSGSVAIGLALAAAIALVVIWLGLGLTYLALMIASAVFWPIFAYAGVLLRAIGLAEGPAPTGPDWGGTARLVFGVVGLTAAFTALMQVLRVAFSGPGPVMAVARNVLAEAVRMKVSLIFIVLLILGLAVLPDMLRSDTPLRYRVQSFLQWGTSLSFWLIALLTVFFAAGTVAFEQRDKQIWQTMTKPVAAWQYLLGKWLGVAGLTAALLVVSCSAVFLFTEYLRKQPALQEEPGQLAADAPPSEDRLILETQVLVARRSVEPDVRITIESPEFVEAAKRYIENARKTDERFARTDAEFERVISDLYKSEVLRARGIAPGDRAEFTFQGLRSARDLNKVVTLRYKINSGENRPDQLFRITFVFGDMALPAQTVTLGNMQTLPLPPVIVNQDGTVNLTVFNGEIALMPDGSPVIRPNPMGISFPPQGLELSYPAGTFYGNYLRVAFALWMKLAFIAMVSVVCATFLSFPVACLVAMAVFLGAEGAGYLKNSLEYYEAMTTRGDVVYWKIPIRAVGLAVAWMFGTYAELQPTARLVQGQLVAWGAIAWSTLIIGCWVAALYGLGVLVFRRRELATYSGH